MKFKVVSSTLYNALNNLSKVLDKKCPILILDKFKFTIEGDELTITASSMECAMKTMVNIAPIEGEGSVCIDSKLLLDTLRSLNESVLEFNIEGGTYATTMSSVFGKYNLTAESADEYPTMQSVDGEYTTSMVSSDKLELALGRVVNATATDEVRPTMCGVLFDIDTESLSVVGSDSRSLYTVDIDDCNATTNKFILHNKNVAMLRGMLKGCNMVYITNNDKNVKFVYGDYTLVCRLIEGNYPNYKAIMPTNQPIKVKVNRSELLKAVQRIASYANKANCLVKFDIKGNNIALSAKDMDFAISADETLGCVHDGSDISIGFKSDILANALSNIGSVNVYIELNTPSQCVLITPADNEGCLTTRMVVMPMMLED